jgi:hypothetical protein
MNRGKQTDPADEKPHRAHARGQISRIRETEVARTLLQDQLHSLYWWVFNASRIKGFLRAKRLDESQPAEGTAREPIATKVAPARDQPHN